MCRCAIFFGMANEIAGFDGLNYFLKIILSELIVNFIIRNCLNFGTLGKPSMSMVS